MQFLLDTNAFIRVLTGDLPESIRRRVLKPTNELLLSIVSPWEIAIKPKLKDGGLSAAVVKRAIAEVGVRVLPITLDHIAALNELPPVHSDPFDRIIIAQCLVEGCTVVSSDARFPNYQSAGLRLLWN